VILADIYAAREDDIYGISSRDVAEAVAKLGTDAHYFDSFEKIEQFVRKSCVDNDLLITMGAGDVTNIGPALLS
jgi:UDP-N-acetylmuramate--alanine ligase